MVSTHSCWRRVVMSSSCPRGVTTRVTSARALECLISRHRWQMSKRDRLLGDFPGKRPRNVVEVNEKTTVRENPAGRAGASVRERC